MGQSAANELPSVGVVPTCKTCGSERVVHDAWACWNPARGIWELESAFDYAYCQACEGETSFVWKKADPLRRQRIRDLNDRFRAALGGHGRILVTPGVAALGTGFVDRAAQAVRTFSGFNPYNDPWDEHDGGLVEVAGEKVMWKIDYYAPNLVLGSDDPSDEAATYRVLTIMLTSEY